IAEALVTVAVLRLRLLGGNLSAAFLLYASLGGFLAMIGYLAAIHWLAAKHAVWLLSSATVVVVAVGILRELSRSASIARERTRRLAALGRFSQQLAHDLRNPLAALKGALQFLVVERKQGRSLDAQADYLEFMLGQVERTNKVIDD